MTAIPDPRGWLQCVPATLQASPFYTEIWMYLQEDAELLALLRLVDPNQPLPITFFTAVNALLLAEPEHPLGQFYPYLKRFHLQPPLPLSHAYPHFRAFVLAHQERLQQVLPTARLQTNEVTRCANLLPAVMLVSQRGGARPLSMIEIGSSAGLNLLWNRYGYHYHIGNDEVVVGDLRAPVQIRCRLLGSHFPPLSDDLPIVASCLGIELLPRNLWDEQDMRWVRAAIWPEEVDRYWLLERAIAFARQQRVPLHAGDACDLLPALLEAIPASRTTTIWDSYALNQGPIAVQQRLLEQIAHASRQRPLYRISLEVQEREGPLLELFEYQGGEIVRQERLAACTVHGESMTWLQETDPFYQ